MPAATAQANANMLNITVSEVLYARELLPRENFTRVKMAGNTLHKMKDPDEEDNSKVAILNRHIPARTPWLKHDVCEALRKRVLQRMDLGIYSNAKCADKHLIESYSFLFTKTADDGYNMVSEVTSYPWRGLLLLMSLRISLGISERPPT
ncbi:hypothetical protein T484DRAFT_1880542 [Baffinella frigidus]|nr:hypothetical protein T484DRAFT_1880542 [Cryptophyta sp. CCMP2293]